MYITIFHTCLNLYKLIEESSRIWLTMPLSTSSDLITDLPSKDRSLNSSECERISPVKLRFIVIIITALAFFLQVNVIRDHAYVV